MNYKSFLKIEKGIYKVNNTFIILLFSSIISLIVALIILLNKDPSNFYKGMFFFPLSYFIAVILSMRLFKKVHFIALFIMLLMFMKNVIVPFIVFLDNYQIVEHYHIELNNSSSNYLLIIFIIVFESLCIAFATAFINKKLNALQCENNKLEMYSNYKKLNIFSILIIIITVLLYLIFPGLINGYRLIFENNAFSSVIEREQLFLNTVPDGLRWIGIFFGELTRFILLNYFIEKVSSKYRNKPNVAFGLSIIIVLPSLLLVGTRTLFHIILHIVIILFVVLKYPEKNKKILISMGILIFVFMLFVANKYFNQGLGFNLGTTLQAYFSGFYYYYQTLDAIKYFNVNFVTRITDLVISEIVASGDIIPRFINFDFSTSLSDYLDKYVHIGIGGYTGLIAPLSVTGYYYFGMLLGPLVVLFPLMLVYTFQKNYFLKKGNPILNLSMSIIFACTPFMYSINNIFRYLLIVYIPLYIIDKLNTIKMRTNK